MPAARRTRPPIPEHPDYPDLSDMEIPIHAPRPALFASGEADETLTLGEDGNPALRGVDPVAGARAERVAPTFAVHGRVVRGVSVVDLLTITQRTDAAMDVLVAVCRDLEARGERPCLKVFRDDAGDVAGIVLCKEVTDADDQPAGAA